MGHCARHGHGTEPAQDWSIPYRYHDSHKIYSRMRIAQSMAHSQSA